MTVSAVNMLNSTPIPSTRANPFTNEAPNWSPTHHRIAHVMRVEMLLSRMAGQARLNPLSMAAVRLRPERNSSFSRSNTRMLASTAIPTERTKPARPDSVIVTGSIAPGIGPILNTINATEMYTPSARAARRPGSL